MKIAFVGKGGSGKTTLSGLFIQYLRLNKRNLLAIDADINMHLAPLIGYGHMVDTELHISNPGNIRGIRTILKGSNSKIENIAHFRKSTPPGSGSYLIQLNDPTDQVVSRYTIGSSEARLMIVGSYGTEGIGVSCYHNNLAILENILSHLADEAGVVVADMVAGTDSFASTLHAQFDLMVLSVEPTRRGIEVFNQYHQLAHEAGITSQLLVVGNKLRSYSDEEFIREHIPAQYLLGSLYESDHLREIERTGSPIEISKIEPEAIMVLEKMYLQLCNHTVDPDTRLEKLHELHRKYVAQDFILERFGDLSTQIDKEFSFKR